MSDAKELIKSRLDIVDVVAEYVQLKPAGAGGAMKGVCPFHAERTPSFHVSRERQIFKCFGCDKGGDIFSFVMEMEGLTFVEALQHLAHKGGIELPEYRGQSESSDQKTLLYEANVKAAEYYATVLRELPYGAKHRTYVAGRDIPQELQDKFQLGAAPEAWDALVLHLQKKGFRDEVIIAAGLGMRRKSGEGIIDRFRGRLMIPLHDAVGKVIGFTARLIPEIHEEGPKYMNSPETVLYKKGSLLYGLHLAKTGIRKSGEVIIVEGNLDVIASHKAGVEQVVASSGTALTEEQLKLLGRYTKRLVFALDEDAAGFAAFERVLELAFALQHEDPTQAFDVRCLVIPEGLGKDADEIVRQDPAAWQRIVTTSQPVIEFYFQKKFRLLEKEGESTVEKRRELVQVLMPHIKRLRRPDERDLYLTRLSAATGVEKGVLKGMVEEKGTENREQRVPGKAVRYEPRATIPRLSSTDQILGLLLGIALQDRVYIPLILAEVPEEMRTGVWKILYSRLQALYTPHEQSPAASTQSLFSWLRADLVAQSLHDAVQALDTLALEADKIFAGSPPHEVRAEVERQIRVIAGKATQQKRKTLEAAIRAAEISGDEERVRTLLHEYSLLLHPPRG